MLRSFVPLGGLVLLSGLAFGQSTETKPAFEIADVHVSPPTRNPFLRGPMVRRGRYEIRVATMVDLVSKAYGVEVERVLGGPNWVENDTWDVIAKAPPGMTAKTAKPMLQSLLAERFKLVIHNDTRSVPAYALKAGKRSQLKEAVASGEPGCKFALPPPPPPPAPGGPPPAPPVISYSCRGMTMASFAQALHTSIIAAGQYLNDRVVVDETELKGTWDFDFKYALRGGPPSADASHMTLFDAMEKLGLKLDLVQTPLPVIVIESVNQKPSSNAPNVAEALQTEPAPTEFEVAELKPTAPDFRGMRIQIQPGGRVNIAGTSVKFLLQQAWNLTDEMIVGAPKWMDADRYDIIAKASLTGPQMDIDDLWPMLRALLTERFKLTTRMEERPVNAYTLMAVKPKMKKADPASHTKFKEGPGADGKDPRNTNLALGRLVTCQNVTMAQFAEKLQSPASGYIHTPVLDATGLEGGYDFTLSFSPVGAVRAPGGEGRGGEARGGAEAGAAPPNDATASASDPNGAITLFEAIEKQLGLKLVQQKRPALVLVIDHAEQKPTDN